MMDLVHYGVKYGLLLAVDKICSRWYGSRPEWLQHKFVMHALSGPIIGVETIPNEIFQDLHLTQQAHPEREVYLSVRSHYSPWYGTRFYHEVSVSGL
jgi:hypothetical protein